VARYVANRAVLALVSILGIAVVIFIVTQLLPGDAARVEAGQYASAKQIEALRVKFGLDKPVPVQLGIYFLNLFRLDLGNSTRTGQPVLAELMQRLPATIELSVAALIVALIIGVSIGLLSAARQGSVVDGVGRGFTILASSTASFWLALLAIVLFCNQLQLFPSPIGRLPRGVSAPPTITGSFVLDSLFTGNVPLALVSLRSLALPAIVLGVVTAPSIIKVVRSATIRALDSDFARASRSFGYSRTSILFNDGLRNSLLPVLTSVGIVAGYLLGGNIIIEQIFSWPGIGQYAYEALQSHDLNALRGFALLVGVVYVLLNTILDVLYAVVDPRVELRQVRA
jgi:ABC-type dipeptide/oligopeptide/nickel transport system permease component